MRGIRFEWDCDKARSNRVKHGVTFEDATRLFTTRVNFLEIYDE
jgi:uncharacterized DUF497 family protein